MKATRLPRPITPARSARLLPVFSSSELAGKRLRHLSGSSSGSDAASIHAPAKAKRAVASPPASAPVDASAAAAPPSPTDIGYASADVSLRFPALLPQRPRRKRDKPCAGPEMIEDARPSAPQPSTSTAANTASPSEAATASTSEGFTLVVNKKKGKNTRSSEAAPPAPATPLHDPAPAQPSSAVPCPRPAPPPAARTSRPAVNVARQQPTSCSFPAFRVPAQQGYETSYDAVAALEHAHPQLHMRNVVGRDGSSVLLPQDKDTFMILDAAASDPEGAVTLTKIDANTHHHYHINAISYQLLRHSLTGSPKPVCPVKWGTHIKKKKNNTTTTTTTTQPPPPPSLEAVCVPSAATGTR